MSANNLRLLLQRRVPKSNFRLMKKKKIIIKKKKNILYKRYK